MGRKRPSWRRPEAQSRSRCALGELLRRHQDRMSPEEVQGTHDDVALIPNGNGKMLLETRQMAVYVEPGRRYLCRLRVSNLVDGKETVEKVKRVGPSATSLVKGKQRQWIGTPPRRTCMSILCRNTGRCWGFLSAHS